MCWRNHLDWHTQMKRLLIHCANHLAFAPRRLRRHSMRWQSLTPGGWSRIFQWFSVSFPHRRFQEHVRQGRCLDLVTTFDRFYLLDSRLGVYNLSLSQAHHELYDDDVRRSPYWALRLGLRNQSSSAVSSAVLDLSRCAAAAIDRFTYIYIYTYIACIMPYSFSCQIMPHLPVEPGHGDGSFDRGEAGRL